MKEPRMTIREITQDDAAAVTDLYLDVCSRLSELDPDWGVPDREPIYRWILRTTESDEAVCLVIELEGTIAGCFFASVARHPAMLGVLGQLEELHVRPGPDEDRLRRELVDVGIAWARDRRAHPIQTTIGLEAPWTDGELSFWTSIGFEHDQALVTRTSRRARAAEQPSPGADSRRLQPSSSAMSSSPRSLVRRGSSLGAAGPTRRRGLPDA
jgi:hypothetical protein